MEKQFTITQSLSLDTSLGSIKQEDDVVLEVTVGIHDDGESGYFEVYDEETCGDGWYIEGGIEFEGMNIVGYDGVFELPDFIINTLVEMGYTDEL